MAGTNPGFNAAEFRDGIKLAMNMGLPGVVTDRPTFHFKTVRSYPAGTRLNAEGEPFDPNTPILITEPPPVQIPCAVEVAQVTPEELPVGPFRQVKATITILDEQWPQVKDAYEVSLGGSRYVVSYTPPPVGLFDVTVYTFVCYAKAED